MVTPTIFFLFFSKPLGILDTEGINFYNNNNNNKISIVPYGRNFRGAGYQLHQLMNL